MIAPRVLLCGTLFVVAMTVYPSASNAQPAPTAAALKVLLEIDETKMTDDDVAALATVIARDVPQEQWPTTTVLKGEGLLAIVKRLYQVYPLDESGNTFAKPMPRATATLVQLIVGANRGADHLLVGQVLRVPPVPVRPKTFNDDKTRVRAFNPQASRYGVVAAADAAAPTPSDQREATKTLVQLAPSNAAALKNTTSSDAVVEIKRETLRVQLLQDNDCQPEQLLTESPYLAAARQIVQQRHAQVIKNAGASHLVIVDFDFASGHGSRVRSAAAWLLDRMGIADLADPQKGFLQQFDLNPSVPAGTDGVSPLLVKALRSYRAFGQGQIAASSFSDASAWLVDSGDSQSADTWLIPAMMLQAALWQQFDQGYWLNLSWQTENATAVLPIGFAALVSARGSFVTVAAGNDTVELPADRAPQFAAASSNRFVNVTYGSRAATIYGTRTNPDGGRVDVLAPGCGFTYGTLVPDYGGSSFASPVVAAAAWLKHLIDGTPASAMRAKLLRASSLLRPDAPKVLAAGVFDPARLIAGDGPHYVEKGTKAIVLLAGVEIHTDACGTFRSNAAAPGSQDLNVYADAGKFFLVARTTRSAFPDVQTTDACEVHTLDMKATQPAGFQIQTLQEFVNRVSYLNF